MCTKCLYQFVLQSSSRVGLVRMSSTARLEASVRLGVCFLVCLCDLLCCARVVPLCSKKWFPSMGSFVLVSKCISSFKLGPVSHHVPK